MVKKLFLFCVIAVLIGISVLYSAGRYLTKPYQSEVGLAPDELPVTNVSFQSESGSQISGWYLKGSHNKGGILLMHGVRSSRLQMTKRAEFLHKAGYSVLLFDFQAHGESYGEKITFGHLESLDAEAAYAFLLDKLHHKSIGVIGVSLGGASALMGAVANASRAIVLESVYPTIEEAISNRLVTYFGSSGRYLLPLLTWQLEPRLGFGADELRPIEHISRITGSVFIIAGAEDKYTTLSESKRLFSEANEPKKIWVVEGASHVDFARLLPKEYELRVLDFFNEAL